MFIELTMATYEDRHVDGRKIVIRVDGRKSMFNTEHISRISLTNDACGETTRVVSAGYEYLVTEAYDDIREVLGFRKDEWWSQQ